MRSHRQHSMLYAVMLGAALFALVAFYVVGCLQPPHVHSGGMRGGGGPAEGRRYKKAAAATLAIPGTIKKVFKTTKKGVKYGYEHHQTPPKQTRSKIPGWPGTPQWRGQREMHVKRQMNASKKRAEYLAANPSQRTIHQTLEAKQDAHNQTNRKSYHLQKHSDTTAPSEVHKMVIS
jgi:hypothetical protein